jgi:Arc/MetJ-type ribon-helix-helix transcriptional regulator
MQVDLTPAQERIVAEAIRSGQYHDAKEVIDDALHVLKVERLAPKAEGSERQQAIERLRRFGKHHGLSLGPELTVKDLINEGRR